MNNNFYQVGGSLPANSKTYIKREADEKLYNALRESKYCYVLNARQVGKSSLRVQTSYNLVNKGYKCVNIDITNIGAKDITVEEWYFSLIFAIIEQLNLEEDEFFELWDNLERLTIINRFARVIDKILDNCPNNIIIFLDEIDSILGIDIFSTDDFFAVIRTFYNMRSENKKYNRLSFAIFGVATAEDLMRNSSRTPFNIAHSIKLTQLCFKESLALIEGLDNQKIEPLKILKKVFNYTSGTPYLTQKILEKISIHPIKELQDIENIIYKLFIQTGFEESNLSNIQNRIISNKDYNIKMLNFISRILDAQKIQANDKDFTQIYLKLSGLVKNKNGYLVYNNKLYEIVFNREWLENTLKKIERPFTKDLNRWIELNKDKSALLRGEVLKKAEKWAKDREDLNSIEYEYLKLSIQANEQKFIDKKIIQLRAIKYVGISSIVGMGLLLFVMNNSSFYLPFVIFLILLGALIAKATKDVLENYFIGLSLKIDAPFEEGERIRIDGGEMLSVVDKGFRATTFYGISSNATIVIPHQTLSNAVITNHSKHTLGYREKITIYIPDKFKKTTLPREVERVLLLAVFLSRGVKKPRLSKRNKFTDFIDNYKHLINDIKLEKIENYSEQDTYNEVWKELSSIIEEKLDIQKDLFLVKVYELIKNNDDIKNNNILKKIIASLITVIYDYEEEMESNTVYSIDNYNIKIKNNILENYRIIEDLNIKLNKKKELDKIANYLVDISYYYFSIAKELWILKEHDSSDKNNIFDEASLDILNIPRVTSAYKRDSKGSFWEINLLVTVELAEKSDEIVQHINMYIDELWDIFDLPSRYIYSKYNR